MLLTTKLERAAGSPRAGSEHQRTRSELRLHGSIAWPEEAAPGKSLLKVPSGLIDVDAGPFVVGGLPFRTVAKLDLLAPDEADEAHLSSVLKERREALLQSLGSWCGGNPVWVRFDRDEGPLPADRKPGDFAPHGIGTERILDDLISSAQARLLLRRKRMSLRVRELVLEDFCGTDRLTFAPSPTQTTVLVGANGSGKTTLLTAIRLLSPTSSK